MQGREKEKYFALILSLVMISLCFVDVNVRDVAIYEGSSLRSRMVYHFFHGNILHCLINVWVFLSIVFRMENVSIKKILISYGIASVVTPVWSMPTVGFSGVLFALIGWMAPWSRNIWRYLADVIPFIAIGFFLPAINARLHLSVFAVAFGMSLLFGGWTRK